MSVDPDNLLKEAQECFERASLTTDAGAVQRLTERGEDLMARAIEAARAAIALEELDQSGGERSRSAA